MRACIWVNACTFSFLYICSQHCVCICWQFQFFLYVSKDSTLPDSITDSVIISLYVNLWVFRNCGIYHICGYMCSWFCERSLTDKSPFILKWSPSWYIPSPYQQTSHHHTSPSHPLCLPPSAPARPRCEAGSCTEPGTCVGKMYDLLQ